MQVQVQVQVLVSLVLPLLENRMFAEGASSAELFLACRGMTSRLPWGGKLL